MDLDRDDAVPEVNEMLREAHALPYLARHDGSDWHLHATEPGAPLGERMRVEAALALTDVIRTDEMGRCGLRGGGLHRAAAGPVPQRLQALLQRALRQPDEHDRLPRTPEPHGCAVGLPGARGRREARASRPERPTPDVRRDGQSSRCSIRPARQVRVADPSSRLTLPSVFQVIVTSE